jgi:hypothetical protein
MHLRNSVFVFFIPVIALILAILIPAFFKVRTVAHGVLCATNYKGLSVAVEFYTKDYDRLPTENWCDIFIEEGVLSPECLVCLASGAIYGESSYAMNKYVAGVKFSDIPSDVVLFFETDINLESRVRSSPITARRHYDSLKELKDIYHGFVYDEDKLVYEDRFNQYGGPEDLVIRHRPQDESGCNVMFVHRGMEFITEDRIADLKWTVE